MARGPFSEITKQTLSGERRNAPVFAFLASALVTSVKRTMSGNALMLHGAVNIEIESLVKSVMDVKSTSFALNFISKTENTLLCSRPSSNYIFPRGFDFLCIPSLGGNKQLNTQQSNTTCN